MQLPQLSLILLRDRFAVCQLDAADAIPGWASAGSFLSITRTNEELSIVCEDAQVPEGTKCERGWRCLRVAGKMEFSVTGVLASLVAPLAEARISVFAIATFDTDYLLLKERDLALALEAFRRQGHAVV